MVFQQIAEIECCHLIQLVTKLRGSATTNLRGLLLYIANGAQLLWLESLASQCFRGSTKGTFPDIPQLLESLTVFSY